MKKILVETSARHVHVSAKDLETLFGAGFQLTPKKDLSQPGQYACNERVTIVGPKREIANVIILGPTRGATQVEISMTDARSIGVDAPIRESGDIAGSANHGLAAGTWPLDRRRQCPGDSSADFRLHRENVGQRSLPAVGPTAQASRTVGEFGGNFYTATGFLHIAEDWH